MNEELHHLPEEVFRISDWIFRQRLQQISPEEAAALNEWKSRSPENEQLVARLMDPKAMLAEMKQFYEAAGETETARQRALARCHNSKEQKPLSGKRFNWWLWTAAAVLIILAGKAGFELMNRKTTNPQAVTPGKTKQQGDLPPGTYTARLTLADGSIIHLDSSAPGKLATQGNTEIINQGGRLQYDTKGKQNTGNYFNTLSTGNGETYSIMLADKSRIWLNAGSAIRFPAAFTGPVRDVSISGEAYIEVAPDASRPFMVRITDGQGNGVGRVEVTGTEFNIMAYADEAAVKLTLLNGRVKIAAGQERAVSLLPGQQARWSDGPVKVIPVADTEQAIGWKNGFFYLQSTSVKELMRQVARWYNVEVVYKAGVDDSQRITGKVPRNISLANLIKVLQLTDINCHIEAGAAPPGKAGRLIIEPMK